MSLEYGIPRDWRMNKIRKRFQGLERTNLTTGEEETSINGTSWHARPNGHFTNEDPLTLPKIESPKIEIGSNGNGKNGDHNKNHANKQPVHIIQKLS